MTVNNCRTYTSGKTDINGDISVRVSAKAAINDIIIPWNSSSRCIFPRRKPRRIANHLHIDRNGARRLALSVPHIGDNCSGRTFSVVPPNLKSITTVYILIFFIIPFSNFVFNARINAAGRLEIDAPQSNSKRQRQDLQISWPKKSSSSSPNHGKPWYLHTNIINRP